MRTLALCLLTIAFAACSTSGADTSRAAVLLLFDVSASTDVAEIRTEYLESFDIVVEQLDLRGGAVVGADVIDDNPLAHSNYISGRFAPYSSTRDNPQTFQGRVEETRSTLFGEVGTLLEGTSQGTDVLNSLATAERFFSAYDEVGEKRLILFSDMINATQEARFGKMRWDGAALEELIARRDEAGEIPDLAGVQVCVVGAGLAEKEHDPERLQWIERFWMTYFERAGADLDEAHYGSALIVC